MESALRPATLQRFFELYSPEVYNSFNLSLQFLAPLIVVRYDTNNALPTLKTPKSNLPDLRLPPNHHIHGRKNTLDTPVPLPIHTHSLRPQRLQQPLRISSQLHQRPREPIR